MSIHPGVISAAAAVAAGGGTAVAKSFASTEFTNLTPVAGWGFIKRNPDYTGPACRVRNSSTGDEVDIDFDSEGFVTDTAPYGANTYVIKLYDQWGSEDVTSNLNTGFLYVAPTGDYRCAYLEGQDVNNIALQTTSTTSGTPAWKLDNMVWALGVERYTTSNAETCWIIPATGTNYASMEFSLQGLRADYLGRTLVKTGLSTQANSWEDRVYRVVGDFSDSSGATGQCIINEVVASSFTWDGTLSYDAGFSLGIGDGGYGGAQDHPFFELHIFDPSATASAAELNYLMTALNDAENPYSFSATADVTSYEYSGTTETYTVPSGVTEISFALQGASGGAGLYNSTVMSGSGGFVYGKLAVTPGDTITIQVGQGGRKAVTGSLDGGAGGYPDGGGGGKGDAPGGGGGGSTRLFLNGTLVAVAAGGAGCAYAGNAGAGGATTGQNATDAGGGTGGSQVAGGLDASDTGNANKTGTGPISAADTTRRGGWGSSSGDTTSGTDDGGGGGGGYYGGGGGGGDGRPGGGGSSYLSGSVTDGVNVGGDYLLAPFQSLTHPGRPNDIDTGMGVFSAQSAGEDGRDGWAAVSENDFGLAA